MTKQNSLTIIGDSSIDLIVGDLVEWPKMGTETILKYHNLRPGGAAVNAALACHYLGERADIIAGTGDDFFGHILETRLQDLKATILKIEAPTTISVGIVHPPSERSFLTTAGHLNQMALDDVLRNLQAPKHAGEIVLLCGVFLTPALQQTYCELIEKISSLGYQIALDTNWPNQGWTDLLRLEILSWISRCNHILLNESEIKNLICEPSLIDAIDILSLHLKEDATLVVKAGAEGAFAIQNGILKHVPAIPTTVQDTVGAGDSFNSAYLLGRLKGLSIEDSLALGCKSASIIISSKDRNQLKFGDLSYVFNTSHANGSEQ